MFFLLCIGPVQTTAFRKGSTLEQQLMQLCSPGLPIVHILQRCCTEAFQSIGIVPAPEVCQRVPAPKRLV